MGVAKYLKYHYQEEILTKSTPTVLLQIRHWMTPLLCNRRKAKEDGSSK
jgi:hypothetical protein